MVINQPSRHVEAFWSRERDMDQWNGIGGKFPFLIESNQRTNEDCSGSSPDSCSILARFYVHGYPRKQARNPAIRPNQRSSRVAGVDRSIPLKEESR